MLLVSTASNQSGGAIVTNCWCLDRMIYLYAYKYDYPSENLKFLEYLCKVEYGQGNILMVFCDLMYGII